MQLVCHAGLWQMIMHQCHYSLLQQAVGNEELLLEQLHTAGMQPSHNQCRSLTDCGTGVAGGTGVRTPVYRQLELTLMPAMIVWADPADFQAQIGCTCAAQPL